MTFEQVEKMKKLVDELDNLKKLEMCFNHEFGFTIQIKEPDEEILRIRGAYIPTYLVKEISKDFLFKQISKRIKEIENEIEQM